MSESPTTARQTYARAFAFPGRSTRSEVLSYALAAVMVQVALSLVFIFALDFEPRMLARKALAVLIAVPVPALIARRCHDSGRSGAWAGLAVLPFVLWLLRSILARTAGIEARIRFDSFAWPLDVLATLASLGILILIALPGSAGPNRFGPDPRIRIPRPESAPPA